MTIPIIFSVDNNVVVPCVVSITSLLCNINSDTFYDIYILYDHSMLSAENIRRIRQSFIKNDRCAVSFLNMDHSFSEVSPIGHITTAAYYRLDIPILFPQFDKVIYADVDMIFQQDLSDVYINSLQKKELLAAIKDLTIDDKYIFKSSIPAKIGKCENDYFNSGFLIMNLKQMRLENIVEKFRTHSKIRYEQNDQDILNVVCKNRVQLLPSLYNFQLNHFTNYMWGRKNSDISFCELFRSATLHYTWKHKPWNSLECVAADTWWYYYKMSPVYDDMVYFRRQYDQIESSRNDYHKLSNFHLFKRILINIKKKIFR